MRTWNFSKLDLLKRQREIAENRDVSWVEVAEVTGVSIPTLIRYRQGRVTDPRIGGVLALSEYFGVNLEFWLEDTDAVAQPQ